MQRRGFPITGSITFAAGVVLGLAALGADTGSPRRNPNLSEFTANAGIHTTRADPESARDLQNARQIPAQTEGGPPQILPPTRSTFMAGWDKVSGAIGYRLDVSTDRSFSSYVNGYRDLDVGNVTGWVVTGLSQGTSYYYRVRAYDATGTSSSSDVLTASTTASIGLIIHATFDSSITSNPNAAAIKAMISRAISIYESLFSDPITVEILFRYSTTAPNGSPFPSGALSQSYLVVYKVPWTTYTHALVADAVTGYDTTANTSLPTTGLSSYIVPSSADGRAVKLNTPPAMFANGTVGSGGPFDGIVTLSSTAPFQFSRPTSSGNFDAQRATEHEMDEILGLGSRLGTSDSNLRPQDLFSWSSAGTRNLTSSGTRYFSINRGTSKIVYFNQTSSGDFGDWLSTACPQAHPYVQNAFSCPGQYSDVTLTSPEAINLDVIGYNLVNAPAPAPTDFNGDGRPDYVLYNGSTRQTVLWYLKNNVRIGAASGPTLPAGYKLVGVADFNRDGHPDYLLFNPTTRQSQIWYLSVTSLTSAQSGPTITSGYELIGAADFNGDGKPDYLLFNPSTRQTVIWYLDFFATNVLIGTASGPTPPTGWSVVAP